MSKPLLTVCLITYNQVAYVGEAVDTILEQKTDFKWELVIADDFSTDGTRAILQEYQSRYPDRIKLILQKKNVGPEKNWLDLMAQPKSKYVLYAEGDDYFTDPTKLQRQVNFLDAHTDFSVCFHPVKVVHSGLSRQSEVYPSAEERFNKKTLGLKDLLARNFIQTGSAMYRWRFAHEDIKKVFPRGIAPGDWFLHVLQAEGGKIGYIDRIMSAYRRHKDSMWWGSYHDRQKFWNKYATPHLKMYDELLKRYGADDKQKKIVDGHILSLLNEFAVTDEAAGSDLLSKAITAFPYTAGLLVRNFQEQITALDNHSKKQAKMIGYYKRESEELREELRLIKASRTYRAAGTAKKMLLGKRADV